MRLVALADIHLGYRAHQRVTPDGLNQREVDVASTFARATDQIIVLAPDLVVIAGDLFHLPRPSNHAILAAHAGLSRLVAACPDTIVVFAAGNHDLSKTPGDASILELLVPLGVHVADRAAKRFYFPDRGLSVLAVPDAPGIGRPSLTPDPRAATNVLVLHGEVQGMLPAWMTAEPASLEISHEELGAERWEYVALGHYHLHTQIAPNCAYSGSLDYTSSNPWKEIDTPKGVIERDLTSGVSTFHALAPSRVYVDLPPIDATTLTALELDAALQAALVGIDGQIVRLVVQNVPRELAHALDQKALRAYKRRAMVLHLDLRRPVYVESALSRRVRGAPTPGASTSWTLESRVGADLAKRELKSDVDRAALIALATSLLEQAREKLPEELESVAAVASIEPAIPSPTQQRGAA